MLLKGTKYHFQDHYDFKTIDHHVFQFKICIDINHYGNGINTKRNGYFYEKELAPINAAIKLFIVIAVYLVLMNMETNVWLKGKKIGHANGRPLR